MAGFKKFEEIVAWQKARNAVKWIYEATSGEKFLTDFALRDQTRRAAISIMANIAEGQGRHSDKEFANFLNISHASVAETQSHLYVALDLGYVEAAEFQEAYDQLQEIAKMTMGLMKHLRSA
ncbi:MAG: four helix bundle protein [Pyrinomonadaceae bacterium]